MTARRRSTAGRNTGRRAARINWEHVLVIARQIVDTSTSGRMTLRQLHYRLVASAVIPNTRSAYKTLSSTPARARREGAFPALIDRTRTIHRTISFVSPAHARATIVRLYRTDRTEGQPVQLILAAEKDTLTGVLEHWFGDLGVPIVPLRGYSSQTYIDEIVDLVKSDARRTVIVYAGDFDSSGPTLN